MAHTTRVALQAGGVAVNVTAHSVARRFLRVEEVEGHVSNPQILAMLRLDSDWPMDDSTPWCSAFVNYIAWLLDLPRSKSLRARSWLLIGTPVAIEEAAPGFDVVVLKRGPGHQPGPEVLDVSGHVGFLAGWEGLDVLVLGGNQGNAVTVARFPRKQVIGIRRLA